MQELTYRVPIKAKSLCKQRISKNGRILVSKKAWAFRGILLSALAALIIFNLMVALSVGDLLIIYSTVIPVSMLAHLIIGWIFFKTRATGEVPDDLVSVIIPVYNQENLIERVVDAILCSTYSNLEVLAVDDGSKDGTPHILDELAKQNPQLKVIHKPNGGKRTAVAAGFYEARGKFVVFIDSDSIMDRYAIEEFMKVFAANPRVGGVVANGKVLNSDENWLTKCQDSWYDWCFNINKTTESTFGTVVCLSGCMAAYRREAVADFVSFWAENKYRFGDDSHMTTYVLATPRVKKQLAPLERRLEKSMASYDDAEDRGLTTHALAREWDTVYAPTAVTYTEVPDAPRKFIRQQTRWRKGYLRSSFYMSSFFYRKNPVMAFLWYLQFMYTFISPVALVSIFLYGPIFLHSYLFPFTYLVGDLLFGLMNGLDYKFRDPTSKHWTYKPLMNLIATFILPWMLFPAIWGFTKDGWLTR